MKELLVRLPYMLAAIGWVYWLFLSYQLGNWWMAAVSFIPGVQFAAWGVGLWSLFFDVPAFVFDWFG